MSVPDTETVTMMQTTNGKAGEGEGKWDKVGDFLQKNLVKGELALKHAVGLGHQPNAVPLAPPKVDGPPRSVEVGWHPVGGVAGKWLAEDTGLGKLITEKINLYPDPTQHWAVLVGDYAHELWMDEKFDVIYINERINRDEWKTFSVGETRFNDDAIRRTGEAVIQSIRDSHPAYNLITNNCQTYALSLLDIISVEGHKEFGTTLAVYERLIGPGKVKDLFDDSETQALVEAEAAQLSVQAPQLGDVPPPLPPRTPSPSPGNLRRQGTVGFAQQVMDQNTTKLQPEKELHKRGKLGRVNEEVEEVTARGFDQSASPEKKKKKKNLFSRFLRK